MTRESGPNFHAWCDPAQRLDAFLAILSAFARPGETCRVWIDQLGRSETNLFMVSIDDALATVRAAYGTGMWVIVDFITKLSSGRTIEVRFHCYDTVFEGRSHPAIEVLGAELGSLRKLRDEPLLEIAIGIGDHTMGVGAAITAIRIQQEVEDILRVLCMPDAQVRVTTCGASMLSNWGAPVETCATYHADGRVGRDLALTWVHLHDGDRTRCAAGLSLDALQARVEAAPVGASVGVASSDERIEEHWLADRNAEHLRDKRPARREAVRNGPRARLPGDISLTREQVLAVLATPPAMLLEAVEASAVPDEEWRSAEPLALEAIQATTEGTPTYGVNVATGRHVRWIEQHAPYHVRRLPDGGVILTTHPYRILWPLWADALSLLGV